MGGKSWLRNWTYARWNFRLTVIKRRLCERCQWVVDDGGRSVGVVVRLLEWRRERNELECLKFEAWRNFSRKTRESQFTFTQQQQLKVEMNSLGRMKRKCWIVGEGVRWEVWEGWKWNDNSDEFEFKSCLAYRLIFLSVRSLPFIACEAGVERT